MKKIILFSFLFSLFSFAALAQNKITGRVIDENGNAVTNASVVIKGTNFGTTSDANGNFAITMPVNKKVLVITYLNMTPQEVVVGNESTVRITLNKAEDSGKMDEVVIVGYSRTTKEAFTGSAKEIKGDVLSNKNVSNVSQALAGEVAGLRVINTSGQPGSSATIRIRGIGSVNGNRAPLYVVDGVPYAGALNSINPNDIASTTVLKDAAATSIYGSRGANGVILITTRNGRSAKSFVEVDGRYGTNSQIIPRYDVIKSPEEYIGLSWEALYNYAVAKNSTDPTGYANRTLFSASGISPNNNIWNVTNGAELIDPVTRMVKPGVTRKYNPENWEDYAFQPSSRVESNIRIGGGDSKTNYYTSFGYLNDKGYIVNSDFRRLTARINLNHQVKTWLSTIFDLSYANTKTNNNGQAANSNSVFWFADNIPSIYPLFKRDSMGNKIPEPIFGGFLYDYGSDGRKFGSLTNAIADAIYNTNTNTRNELTGNTSANIHFNKNLTLENRLGVQYYGQNFFNLTNKFYGSAFSQNGSIGQTRDNLMNLNLLNLLRYGKRFGSHNVEALAAHEATRYTYTRASSSGYNLVNNTSLDLSNAIVKNPTSNSYSNTNRLESFFGQVNYDYKSTYYLSGTIRRDGSSRFTAGNAWGTFGSVGAGWVVSKMEFMKNSKFLNYLKLKASYGVLGDQDGLGLYPGSDRYDINNLNNNPSFTFVSKGNPDLTWETSKMSQVGVDFKLGKFLDGTVEAYRKNTENLIFDRRVGPSSGFALLTVNDGQLRNQGIEFDLTGHLLKTTNSYIDLRLNGEHYNNTILKMPIDPSTKKEKIIDVQGLYAYGKGHSIYDFYTRSFEGVDPLTGVSLWKVYYDDKNGNKGFDAGEEVTNLEQYGSDFPEKLGGLQTGTTNDYAKATLYYVGKSSIPKVRGAANLNIGYLGFNIDVQLLYSFGGYSYDGAYAGLMNNGLIGGNNWHTDIRNRWQKPGDITNVPRLSNNLDANVASGSTRFLTKADYISLNNIRFAYTLPTSLTSRAQGLQSLSFYISGDNLWIKTKRNGFNPSTAESGGSDIYRYSPLSTISVGLKAKF